MEAKMPTTDSPVLAMAKILKEATKEFQRLSSEIHVLVESHDFDIARKKLEERAQLVSGLRAQMDKHLDDRGLSESTMLHVLWELNFFEQQAHEALQSGRIFPLLNLLLPCSREVKVPNRLENLRVYLEERIADGED